MMTSERTCFVYIQLPGTLELVTCGRYQREVLRDGRPVGRFVYGRTYRSRADAVPIDPYQLPLARVRYETARLEGMFGALRDASPDAWGRRVIERMTSRADLDPLDYLLLGPEDRIGALSFGLGVEPPAPRRDFNRVLQLAELREAARLLEEDRADALLPEQLRQLTVPPGTSLGGARPKNGVEDEEGLWIAKFPQRGDRWNNAPVEAAMLALARRCGIQTPATRIERIGADQVLLVKRFDRDRATGGYHRHRMVSALTVLDADDSVTERTNWSYLLLADELRRWSERPVEDRRELFRRIVFNSLISNTDDHPRNHALVAPGEGWHLAPAYDLTPMPSVSVERRDLALECGPMGRAARRDNLLAGAPRFGVSREEASVIMDEMKAIVGKEWRGEIRRQGGNTHDCALVESAFLYEGFEYSSAE